MHELGEKAQIDDAFPNENILVSSQDLMPLFQDIANYIASDLVF